MNIPNWTTNRIICKKELGDKLLTKTKNGYELDFNKLIPMPKDLEITAGSQGEKGLIFLYITSNNQNEKDIIEKAYKTLNSFNKQICNDIYFKKINSDIQKYKNGDEFKEDLDLGKKYLDNYKKYGYCNWYNWSINNWGTKWNVKDDCTIDYDDSTKEYTITFDTAWSCPTGILKEYSKMCEDGELDWMYYDEDYDGHIFITKENNELMIRKEYREYDLDENIDI
ncbi:MAG: hypothetical protein J6O56_03335 [Bacilli bacterium]|nr:hypothetical protein [Bacilli bacterium]